MKEELLKLYYDYSINGLIADRKYVVKFVEIVCNYAQLNQYLESIAFINVNKISPNTLSSYNCDTKQMLYYIGRIDDIIQNYYGYDVLIPEEERIFYKNAFISSLLLHELEHVSQYKSILEKNDIEASILKLSRLIKYNLEQGKSVDFNDLMDNSIYIYNEYYEFSPEERLAEIRSHRNMSSIISPIKNIIPNVKKIEDILTLNNELKGYKKDSKLISPTIFYLHLQGKKEDLQKFEWYDESLKESLKKSKRIYDLDSRIDLGLPIEQSEFNHLQRNLNKMVKSL